MINELGSLQVEGTLIQRDETKHPSDKFRYREFVLEVNMNIDGNSSVEFFKLKAIQELCDFIDDYRCGYRLIVTFKITGRKWVKRETNETSYFNNLEAINIEVIDDSHNLEADILPPETKSVQEDIPMPDESDDLPF